jgi:hypothetical protein
LVEDGRIPPIESIEKTLRVKPIGSIRLFKRPEYMPQKKKNSQFQDNQDNKEGKKGPKQKHQEIINHASHAGKIGVSVDYKV